MTSKQESGSMQAAKPPRVFNVLDYGAVADDATDNTAAFSACLEAVVAAGGGRMYLPAGVYRGRIVIPIIGPNNWIAIEIVGESQPTPIFGTIGAFKMQNDNSIVKCLATSGEAVIFATPDPRQFGQFSGVCVVVRDLAVRTCDNPQIGGIHLGWAQQCRLENVVVDTGVYSVQASLPTHGTKGIVTPFINNGALTQLRNVAVSGYATGIEVNEHTDADGLNLTCNLNGLTFVTAYHSSRFGRVAAQRCTRAVNVAGEHGFTIEALNIEHAGEKQTDEHNRWQSCECDIHDPKNLGIGELRYWVVLGAFGISKTFTKTGGAGIHARRIGDVPGAESGR